jgi:ATP-dependent Clp protease ATP-binding subunit ClpA
MFERFAPEMKMVLDEALTCAAEVAARNTAPGHLLFALATVGDQTAGRPLLCAGITTTTLRLLLSSANESAGQIVPNTSPPLSRGSNDALNLAVRVAEELHQPEVRPGHLLLALLRQDAETVSEAIESCNTDRSGLSAAVLSQLSTSK